MLFLFLLLFTVVFCENSTNVTSNNFETVNDGGKSVSTTRDYVDSSRTPRTSTVEEYETTEKTTTSTSTSTTSTEMSTTTTELPCFCGNFVYKSDEMEGVIKNPSRMNHYCELSSCTYTIEPHENMAISLKVVTLKLITKRLYLHQFVNNNGSKILMYQGRIQEATRSRSRNYNYWSHDYGYKYSYENAYKLYNSAVNTGFQLTLYMNHVISRSDEFMISFTRTKDTVCPYPLLSPDSTFQTIKFPKTNCEWPLSGCVFQMTASEPFLHVVLNLKGVFEEFRAEVKMGNDNIDGEKLSFSPYGDVTRTVGPSFSLWIRADGQETATTVVRITGIIRYHAIDFEPCLCDPKDVFLSGNESSQITSPGFPNLYCSSFICKHKFQLEESNSPLMVATFEIEVNFLSASYSDELSFIGDNQQIFSSDRKTGLGSVYTVVAKSLEVWFRSSTAQERHGFNVTVKRVEQFHDCLCPSSGTKELKQEGSISLKFGEKCHRFNCVLAIKENYYSYRIQMELNYLLPNINDEVVVKENSLTHRLSRKTLGDMNTFLNVKLPVLIEYRRNIIDEELFLVNNTYLNMTWKERHGCSCDQSRISAKDKWETITSPNYPMDYCSDLYCTHKITAPQGSQIVINITDFSTEPFSDLLTIFDSHNTSGKHMEQLHGKRPFPTVLRSTNSTMALVFTTDHSETAKGFKIRYKYVWLMNEEPTFLPWYTVCLIFVALSTIIAISVVVYRKKRSSPQLAISTSFARNDDTASVSSSATNNTTIWNN